MSATVYQMGIRHWVFPDTPPPAEPGPCPTCVREGGPYRCCIHCAEDSVHDVPKDGHDLPCSTCVILLYGRGQNSG